VTSGDILLEDLDTADLIEYYETHHVR